MIDKTKQENIKKTILIPDIKIKTDQLKKTNKVWPISGCAASNKAISRVIKKVDKYLKYMFAYFSLLKITLIKIIKNGLTSSIGWNIGKKYKSIHLWALLTSTPIIGTKNKVIKENMNIKGEKLKSFFSLMVDKIKIINTPKNTNVKCFKKNA